MERGAQVIAQGGLRDGEWFGRPDVLSAGGEAEQAVGLVVRSGRYEVGARNKSDDDSATVAVLGFAEANSRGRCRSFCGWCRRARGIRR